MEYEKDVMSKKELMKKGFPRRLLDRAYQTPGQTFAWRNNPNNRTSSLLFDTKGFEKWRLNQIRMEQNAMKLREGVM